jgi:hypothetical protein
LRGRRSSVGRCVRPSPRRLYSSRVVERSANPNREATPQSARPPDGCRRTHARVHCAATQLEARSHARVHAREGVASIRPRRARRCLLAVRRRLLVSSSCSSVSVRSQHHVACGSECVQRASARRGGLTARGSRLEPPAFELEWGSKSRVRLVLRTASMTPRSILSVLYYCASVERIERIRVYDDDECVTVREMRGHVRSVRCTRVEMHRTTQQHAHTLYI